MNLREHGQLRPGRAHTGSVLLPAKFFPHRPPHGRSLALVLFASVRPLLALGGSSALWHAMRSHPVRGRHFHW